ncbi:MAG TPA: hypothetical protein VFU36_00925 [Jatrophihabitans sp.]|nr:hypothetical protein [Jatrophihabitans sp.]
MNKHCIRKSIIALTAAAFGLISLAGSAQALADSGHTSARPQASISVSTGTSVSLSGTITLAPSDSSWD